MARHRFILGKSNSRLWMILLLASVPLCFPQAALAAPLDPQLFPTPPELEANVRFWSAVYTKYTSRQVLLHDERHMDIIYEVIDLEHLEDPEISPIQKELRRKEIVRAAVERTRAVLINLAAGRAAPDQAEEHTRIARLLAGIPGGREKFRTAIDRLRTQTCLQNRFAEGIERSGRYMPAIEEIFARRGLPSELTRMPFVESLFQTRAQSSASASGIWQFVPATGRLYLRMGIEFDERLDPLKATEAAAKLLTYNHKKLGTWPLAVTAYNHGAGGMARAVRRLGTRDMGQIATRYRSRTFGFASRNFYSELLAAHDAYENRASYFPGTEPLPPRDIVLFTPDHYVELRELAKASDVDLEELRDINPALSSEIWRGNLYLPKGYALEVPAAQVADMRTAYAELADSFKREHQVGFRYRVKRGDTLGRVAARYGVSVSAIQRANRLASANRIRIGQVLLIPPGGTRTANTGSSRSSSAPTRRAAVPADGIHVVRRGETLSVIARRYGISLSRLLGANSIDRASRIYPGQKLRIPGAGGGASGTHVVQRGETLSLIARRYKTSVQAMKRLNKMRGDVIHPGQVLEIP